MRFTSMERRKAALLERGRGWNAECSGFQPNADSWSSIGVLDHLQRTEAAILETVRGAQTPLPSVPGADRVKTAMIIGLFRLPSKVKVPGKVSRVNPAADKSLSTVERAWADTRVEMREYLEDAPEEALTGGVCGIRWRGGCRCGP